MLGTYDYPRSHRLFEIFSITVFGAFASVLAWRTLDGIATRTTWSSYPLHIMALLAGYAAADLASGIVHYLLDNFGSPNTPIIGQKFVKPFRDHHVDPMEMTRGDLIAVNADNVFICLPVIIPVYFLLDAKRHPVIGVFLLGLTAAVVMTNQLHKWAHMPTVPRWVAWAQRMGIVLSSEHHAVHHSGAYDRNYCITWGLLDAVLNPVVISRHHTPLGH